MGRGRILVSGEDAATRIVVNQALARAGYSARGTRDAATLWKWIRQGDGDAVIADVVPPSEDEFCLIPRIKDIRPDLPVIVLTAQDALMTAIEVTERRAYEYVPKPFDIGMLMTVVEQALQKPVHLYPPRNEDRLDGDCSLVGHSAEMQEIHRLIARLLCTDLPVLITGESGTGKTLAAYALHDWGPRHEGPFVALNMTAIHFNPLDAGRPSGDDEGALTSPSTSLAGRFEQAIGGTLFLDEIGDMSVQMQTELLRLLQEDARGSVGEQTPDVRIIAATNKNLADQMSRGLFREDLYYRLNVVPLHMPSLREHVEDVSDLVQHFQQLARQNGLQVRTFTQDAIQRLKRHCWPGNVRELRNLIERIYAIYSDEIISADIVERELPVGEELASEASLRESVQAYLSWYFETFNGELPPPGLYDRIMHEVEEPLLSTALITTGGNQLKAARLLGLNRNTLRKKIREQRRGS